jgi:Iron-containing redox enzyme
MWSGAAQVLTTTLPSPRGPVSTALVDRLTGVGSPLAAPALSELDDPLADDDLQLALYLCYELHYRGLPGIAAEWEWNPELLGFRRALELAVELSLFEAVGPPGEARRDVGAAIFELVSGDLGPSLSGYIEKDASLAQFREFLIHRSAYQLKEADPHSWAIPRLDGPPKAALVEVQADEYGGGDPSRVHATLFANTMDALGLESRYGSYLERLPGSTLATVNLMSLFGLHRRWRGALVGHLAGFEVSSPLPNGRYAKGLRRLGYDSPAVDFFDEHVEADSVHENIAAYDLAGGLASREPSVAGDILFGVRSLLFLDSRFATAVLGAWQRGETSLLGF